MILGGYGQLGRSVAALLAREREDEIIVCGRDLQRAEKTAGELSRKYPGRAVSAVRADAAYTEELVAVLADIDLVVVCTTECGSGRGVLEAAVRAGVDCVDLRYPQSLAGEARALQKDIEQAGRCFLIQAGHMPGLASVLLRLAAGGNGDAGMVELATAMRLPAMTSQGAAEEIVGIIRDLRREAFEAGRWRKVGLRALKKVYFGDPFGTITCIPVRLSELDDLPGELGLRNTVMYVAGGYPLVDAVVVPLIMLSGWIMGRATTRLFARMLMRGTNVSAKPPFGAVFQVAAANGVDDGEDARVKVRLWSDDSYRFAGAAAVAQLLQYLDGSIGGPGLWFMGHEVDPRRVLADMERMGVTVKTGEDAG